GDGVTAGNSFQEFVAPAGATRVFLGITDAFGFNGPPGAFDDNNGSYRIRVGINEEPTIPEPSILVLLAFGLLPLAQRRLSSAH
ncbi:MAG: PEP-CTERM sorting domain-containing protein, partial [Chromatiaceae bacterium]|nr:PEP-CTERM sorting domain-containing protein [Chromatiaceae bacterium]